MPKSDVETELNPVAEIEHPLDIDYKEAKDEKSGPETDLEDFLQELKADVEKDDADRTTFNQKAVTAYQLRRGQIGKKDKNVPFPNSSDLRFPIPEMKIREKKSGYVSVLWDSPKMVRYSPGGPQKDQSKNALEFFANYLYRCEIPRFYFTAAAAADKMAEVGKSYVKVTWEHKTEWRTKVFLKEDGLKLTALIMNIKYQSAAQASQEAMQQGQSIPKIDVKDEKFKPTKKELVQAFAQTQDPPVDLEDEKQRKHAESCIQQYLDGKETMTWMHEVTIAHRPCVQMLPENQSLIFPIGTKYIGDAERITQEMFYNKRQLLVESEENGGTYKNVQELIDEKENPSAPMTTGRQAIESARAAAEGIQHSPTFEDSYRIFETCCWMPRKHISRFLGVGGNDNTPVRAIVTFCPDVDPNTVGPLRIQEFPYDHYEWPYHEFIYNYRIDRSQDAQGIPEMIDAFVREFNASKNASTDRSTICNSPPTLIWDQAGITPQQFRQVGQGLKTECPPSQAVQMVQYPNLKDAFEFDAQSCTTWIDQLIGSPNLSPLQNRVNSPTKAEVMATVQPSNSIDYFEHNTWLQSWAGVFRQVHYLCKQYWFLNEDSYQFPRTDKPDVVMTISKQDFDGKWIIQSGGDPSKVDPQMELQKWMIALQMATSIGPVGMATKIYTLINGAFSRLLGHAEAAEIMQGEQAAKQAQDRVEQMASQNLQRQMENKRPQRQAKIRQPPGASMSLLAQ